MKKKISLFITAGALLGLLIVGGTLAWFTDTKEATNTFAMGNVAIDLLENGTKVQDENEDLPNGFTGLDFTNLVPGDEEDKRVEVKNVGSVDAYVRIKLTAAFDQEELSEADIDLLGLLDLNVGNNGEWEKVGDFYYYKGKLVPNQMSEELFTSVTIPTGWGNEMANKSFQIHINVDAIQAKHIYEVPQGGTFSAGDLAAAWTSATN